MEDNYIAHWRPVLCIVMKLRVPLGVFSSLARRETRSFKKKKKFNLDFVDSLEHFTKIQSLQ